MRKKLSEAEKNFQNKQIVNLYVSKNLSLLDISTMLKIPKSTVYDRLIELSIKINKQNKPGFLNKNRLFTLPKKRSDIFAEFVGIMLGDGCLNKYQIIVTLGNKELSYAHHVCKIIKNNFNILPKISIRKTGYFDVYVGSKDVVDWLLKEGLVFNKVKSQVDIPVWIFRKKTFMENFLRGFFDTDGSIYKLKYGIQISFTNKSGPLLVSLHKILKRLEYKTSEISSDSIYITDKENVKRFFKEIKPKNPKHQKRYQTFVE